MTSFQTQFRRNIHSRWLWLLRQKGTPAQRARGVAAGVFSGCFPLFGLQTILGIILASFLKGNQLIAAAATWISNPLTYLPLYWFNYQIGSAVLGEVQLHQGVSGINTIKDFWSQGWMFSSRLLVGYSLVGLFLGISAGLISYRFFKSSCKERRSC